MIHSVGHHLLSIGKLLRPGADVHSVLSIRRNEPLDLASQGLKRLFGCVRERVRNVYKYSFIVLQTDSCGATTDGKGAEARLGRVSRASRSTKTYKRLAKGYNARYDLANYQVYISGVLGCWSKRGEGDHSGMGTFVEWRLSMMKQSGTLNSSSAWLTSFIM
jgi:hypothetical protein